jgi:hypothetical protein
MSVFALSTQTPRNYLIVAAAIIIAAVLISASLFVAIGQPTKTVTATSTMTTTVTTTSTITAETSGLKGVVFLMDVNGSYYWADDVSKDIVIGSPGYSYFLNGSVTFDGVKFQTVCPSIYRDCPGSNNSSTVVYADVIQLKMTFPNGTNATVGRAGFFTAIPTYVLSQNSTQKAGMLIEYVNDYNYPYSTTDYAVFLLVSSCGAAPNLC